MATSNVIIPPEFSQPVMNREKIWAEFDNSQRLSAELNELVKQIPDCSPAGPQLQFGADSIPPNELQTVLPLLKQELETANKLRAEVKGCFSEIEAIKRKEKTTIIVAVVGGAVLLLIILIIIVSVVSSSGPPAG